MFPSFQRDIGADAFTPPSNRGPLKMDIQSIYSTCPSCRKPGRIVVLWNHDATRCKQHCVRCGHDAFHRFNKGGLPMQEKGWVPDTKPVPLLEPHWDKAAVDTWLTYLEGCVDGADIPALEETTARSA